MKNKRKTTIVCIMVVLFCVIMAVIDGVLQTNYFVKSGIKFFLFLGFPILYSLFDRELEIKSLFRPNGYGIKLAVWLSAGVYFVIFVGYILLRNVFDFSAITRELTANIGVNRENFLYVSLYISFVNSLLEEFFFRGISFLTLRKVASKRFAYLFSASAFSLYHIAMMIGWFSAEVFVIVLMGLFAGGLIFNYLNAKSESIYPSWLVHMFANFAINTVGFILFGIITI